MGFYGTYAQSYEEGYQAVHRNYYGLATKDHICPKCKKIIWVGEKIAASGLCINCTSHKW